MKRFFFLFLPNLCLVLWLLAATLQAQILPQQWAVSGTGNLGFERPGNSIRFFFTGQVEGLYFLDERWAVGAQVGFGGQTGRLDDSYEAAVGPVARYYFRNQAEGWLLYASASPAYRGRTFTAMLSGPPVRFERFTQEEFLLSGGLGISRFLAPSALLDIQLNAFHPLPLRDSPQFSGNVRLLFGLMFLLPSAEQKQ